MITLKSARSTKQIRRFAFLLVAPTALSLVGCARQSPAASPALSATPVSLSQRQTPPPRQIMPTNPAAPPAASIRFQELAQASGLTYQWKIEGKRPLTILQTIGNGCAFLDYDNDGNLDVLLVGPKLALFRGDGKGHFTDVTTQVGLNKLKGHFLGCAVGDYDNDGFDDVYVSAYRGGLLLHNEGGKGFRDVTAEAGLKAQPWGTSCSFADVDNDGKLDLYICNYVQFGPDELQTCPFQGIQTGCGPRDYDACQGVLYHNEGGGHFRDVTRAWKIATHGKALGVAFADFDRSGRVGFAVANDLMPGDLLQNQARGKLQNIGRESGTATDEAGETHAGMGVDWGDYDNDGRFDLFVTTFSNETKCLYHNEGYNQFSVVSERTGIETPALPYVGWGCKFFDADNDGWLDLIVANGHVQDNIARFEKKATFRQPTLFLHNRGGAQPVFEDATKRAGLAQLPKIVGRGLAVGDYDNDGRVDVLVVDSDGKPLLLHNESAAPANGWVGFRLIGRAPSARNAYGAVVTLRAREQKWVRQCQPGGSYLSSSDARVHFGFGALTPESVTIRWPDGASQTLTDIPTGRYVVLREGSPPE